MIFDSDVLIWCLRGNQRAAAAIEKAPYKAISVVSTMELIQGARNRRELGLIRSFLKDLVLSYVTPYGGHRAPCKRLHVGIHNKVRACTC